MSSYFNPISASIEDMGAVINSSKKKFVWRFELEAQEHLVELECSFLTSRRRVYVDGAMIFKGTKAVLSKEFEYKFKLTNHILTVRSGKSDADLNVDNLSFNDLYSKKLWEKIHGFRKSVPQDKVEPKAARFVSEEEFKAAAGVSEVKSRSLREILEKKSNGKPALLPSNFLAFSEVGKNTEGGIMDLIGLEKNEPSLLEFGDERNANTIFKNTTENFTHRREKEGTIGGLVEGLHNNFLDGSRAKPNRLVTESKLNQEDNFIDLFAPAKPTTEIITGGHFIDSLFGLEATSSNSEMKQTKNLFELQLDTDKPSNQAEVLRIHNKSGIKNHNPEPNDEAGSEDLDYLEDFSKAVAEKSVIKPSPTQKVNEMDLLQVFPEPFAEKNMKPKGNLLDFNLKDTSLDCGITAPQVPLPSEIPLVPVFYSIQPQ